MIFHNIRHPGGSTFISLRFSPHLWFVTTITTCFYCQIVTIFLFNWWLAAVTRLMIWCIAAALVFLVTFWFWSEKQTCAITFFTFFRGSLFCSSFPCRMHRTTHLQLIIDCLFFPFLHHSIIPSPKKIKSAAEAA